VAGHGRKIGLDDQLALALAGGASVEEAANQAGCSERTAFRRLQEPAFRALVDATRSRMVEGTIGRLAALGATAVEKLQQLMATGATENVQLGASRTALGYLFQSTELITVARQVEELKRQVEELHRGTGRRQDAAAEAGNDPARANGQPPSRPGTSAG
jgi:hypothetical protein